MALADLFPIAAPRPGRATVAWLVLLLAAAALSSVTFACVTPFSAFAVLLAATLPPRSALAGTVAIWLVNQLLGFGALGYPLDGMTVAWGGAIGVAAIAATAAVSLGMALMPSPWPRLAFGFVAALAAYEGLLYLAALVLGGAGNFAPDIVAKVALSDGAWLVGLAILRHFLPRLTAPAGLLFRT